MRFAKDNLSCVFLKKMHDSFDKLGATVYNMGEREEKPC